MTSFSALHEVVLSPLSTSLLIVPSLREFLQRFDHPKNCTFIKDIGHFHNFWSPYLTLHCCNDCVCLVFAYVPPFSSFSWCHPSHLLSFVSSYQRITIVVLLLSPSVPTFSTDESHIGSRCRAMKCHHVSLSLHTWTNGCLIWAALQLCTGPINMQVILQTFILCSFIFYLNLHECSW